MKSILVIAGHETTANLMVWTLNNLVTNDEVYGKLEREVDSVLDNDFDQENGDETILSNLSMLNYTESVLKESLRLDQPVPSIVRKAVQDNTLVASDGKEIRVKKGTDIKIDIYNLHQ